MRTECILSDYLEQAMEAAAYDKLDDEHLRRADSTMQGRSRLWNHTEGM